MLPAAPSVEIEAAAPEADSDDPLMMLAAYAEPAVRLMCDIWEGCGADPRRQALDERFAKLAPQGKLPDRIVRGDDLAARVKGAALGEALAAAYEAQLEGRFHDRAGALTWAGEWLKLKNQGSPS